MCFSFCNDFSSIKKMTEKWADFNFNVRFWVIDRGKEVVAPPVQAAIATEVALGKPEAMPSQRVHKDNKELFKSHII